MDLNAAMIFGEVVRSGSFTKAARSLRLPNSTVSDRVSDLEKSLGVTLLTRTTRKLRLTEAGALFYAKAEVAITSLQSAGEEVSAFQKQPSGTLKMTFPADFDTDQIWKAVLEYRRKFPAVKVEVHFMDRIVDILGEGFDIAVRVSPLKDSNLTAKKIRDDGLVLVASPKYLKKSAAIRQPADLLKHRCIVFLSDEDANDLIAWDLVSENGKRAKVVPKADIFSNSCSAILELIISGEGIALMPQRLVCNKFSKDQLIRVLPEWSTGILPTYIVYPTPRASSPKVREMIPILEKALRTASS